MVKRKIEWFEPNIMVTRTAGCGMMYHGKMVVATSIDSFYVTSDKNQMTLTNQHGTVLTFERVIQ